MILNSHGENQHNGCKSANLFDFFQKRLDSAHKKVYCVLALIHNEC